MKIYIASKASHRPRWRAYRDGIYKVNIISRWIDVSDEHTDKPSDSGFPLDYVQLWQECVDDVKAADVVVVYVEPGEVLKGALIEAGVALGLGKRVVILSQRPIADPFPNGTWYHHPLVEIGISLNPLAVLINLSNDQG